MRNKASSGERRSSKYRRVQWADGKVPEPGEGGKGEATQVALGKKPRGRGSIRGGGGGGGGRKTNIERVFSWGR